MAIFHSLINDALAARFGPDFIATGLNGRATGTDPVAQLLHDAALDATTAIHRLANAIDAMSKNLALATTSLADGDTVVGWLSADINLKHLAQNHADAMARLTRAMDAMKRQQQYTLVPKG